MIRSALKRTFPRGLWQQVQAFFAFCTFIHDIADARSHDGQSYVEGIDAVTIARS